MAVVPNSFDGPPGTRCEKMECGAVLPPPGSFRILRCHCSLLPNPARSMPVFIFYRKPDPVRK